MSQTADKKYILIRNIKFTLLEDFILRVLEEKQGCSDKEIANTLCMQPDEIEIIIDDDGLKGLVQGDFSRRTLKEGFTREQFNFVTQKDNKLREYEQERTDCHEDRLVLFYRGYSSLELHGPQIPKDLKKLKARKYYKYTQEGYDLLCGVEK